jgi:hypothetical protein
LTDKVLVVTQAAERAAVGCGLGYQLHPGRDRGLGQADQVDVPNMTILLSLI